MFGIEVILVKRDRFRGVSLYNLMKVASVYTSIKMIL